MSRGLHVLVSIVGVMAFMVPFWFPAEGLGEPRAGQAPLVTALIAILALAALALDLRMRQRSAAELAVLGVLSATAGLLRLFDLPGGGSGIFFLILLAGVGFGPMMGLYCGLFGMALGGLVTGGIGPWLPYQMLAAGWLGASAGWLGTMTERLRPRVEVALLAALGWLWGFLYGAILNLWFWPVRIGTGELDWNPDLSLGETIEHYWRFYLATSFAWDAAGAITNAVLILLTGRTVLESFRRVRQRLAPPIYPAAPPPTAARPSHDSVPSYEAAVAISRSPTLDRRPKGVLDHGDR